jgi:hypothetical protein
MGISATTTMMSIVTGDKTRPDEETDAIALSRAPFCPVERSTFKPDDGPLAVVGGSAWGNVQVLVRGVGLFWIRR